MLRKFYNPNDAKINPKEKDEKDPRSSVRPVSCLRSSGGMLGECVCLCIFDV